MKVRIATQLLDASGNPLAQTIRFGTQFTAELTAQDLRSNADSGPYRGIYACYASVHYSGSLAKILIPEVQKIDINPPAGSSPTGTFVLNIGKLRTVPIYYSLNSTAGIVKTARNIVEALKKIGYIVEAVSRSTRLGHGIFLVSFVGRYEIGKDIPTLVDSSPYVTITEVAKGGSHAPEAFIGAFDFDEGYESGRQAIDGGPGLIKRLGSFDTDITAGGDDMPVRIVSWKMQATSPGFLSLTPSTLFLERPMDDTLVYGQNEAVKLDEMEFQSSFVTITS